MTIDVTAQGRQRRRAAASDCEAQSTTSRALDGDLTYKSVVSCMRFSLRSLFICFTFVSFWISIQGPPSTGTVSPGQADPIVMDPLTTRFGV